VTANFDEYTALLQISLPLVKFLTKCLDDKMEYMKLASIRALEFLIENLGCSLGMLIPYVLQEILARYPKTNEKKRKKKGKKKPKKKTASKTTDDLAMRGGREDGGVRG